MNLSLLDSLVHVRWEEHGSWGEGEVVVTGMLPFIASGFVVVSVSHCWYRVVNRWLWRLYSSCDRRMV